MEDEEKYKKKLEQIVKDINLQQVTVAEKQKETVNIDEAVENIKQGLVDIGITDFHTYWQIVKDRTQASALIANCMRNIIEYFFNFVEKLDFPQVFQKPELQDTRFLAFNLYMNRESHSKGQNIFDIKEFDYDSFRDAFKLVFEIEGYPEHYQKMMK